MINGRLTVSIFLFFRTFNSPRHTSRLSTENKHSGVSIPIKSGLSRARSDLVPEPRGLPEARAQPGVREDETAVTIEHRDGGTAGCTGPVQLSGAISSDEHLRAKPEAVGRSTAGRWRRRQRRGWRPRKGTRGERGAAIGKVEKRCLMRPERALRQRRAAASHGGLLVVLRANLSITGGIPTRGCTCWSAVIRMEREGV